MIQSCEQKDMHYAKGYGGIKKYEAVPETGERSLAIKEVPKWFVKEVS